MIIGIDGNEANVERKVGISEYAFELLHQFYRFKINDFKFIIYLKYKPREDFPEEREGWEYKVIGPKNLWTQIALPLALFNDISVKGRQINIFFSPTHYAPRFSPIPTAISIMDLSYIYFPEMFKKTDLFQLRRWTAYSVNKAKRIFTISNASKNDIIKQYNIPGERVVVTYPGIKIKTIMQNAKIKEKYKIEGDYILFVGTLQPRKNIVRLIEAFAKLKKPSIKLIIVGKKGWLFEEILEAPKRFGVQDKVKFLEFVSDEDLHSLYRHAICFVLPSLYEGFGLPILEAMQEGCPVITSNVSSLPEAGGEAALYIDPENVEDIAEKINLMLVNEKIRNQMIEKGYEQVKKFSWEKTARETLSVLEDVAKNYRDAEINSA